MATNQTDARIKAAEDNAAKMSQLYNTLCQHVNEVLKKAGIKANVNHAIGRVQLNGSEDFVDIGRYIQMGRDFEKILDAIKENEVTKAQWDKLVMTLRLTQQ